MGYALPMSSSFVYQPHVHQSDGTVITPDILIERVFVSGTGGVLSTVPVFLVSSAAALQQPADSPIGAAAVVLVAASYGLLVSVGAILEGALPVARAAWRFDDVGSAYGDVNLRSWGVQGNKRTAFVSEQLAALMSPTEAMAALGNASGLQPQARDGCIYWPSRAVGREPVARSFRGSADPGQFRDKLSGRYRDGLIGFGPGR